MHHCDNRGVPKPGRREPIHPPDVGLNGYSGHDVARIAPEPAKPGHRSAFARDRARVLHSAGLRRLAAKTQVLVAGEMDFPRTRLTHTLEVAQIARELGAALGADPDLADLAGLAHDLGHPPFGHNGEAALAECTRRIGGFEGNAQTFRLLTRLESKVMTADRSVGLNLTRASLDATIKYPWGSPNSSGKFGFYPDDAGAFAWVRDEGRGTRMCFEAQIMDWSDDVAYSVHDVEDGAYAGHIDVRCLTARADREGLAQRAHEWYAPWAEPGELAEALERIAKSPAWPFGFDGSPSDLARLKGLTSELTGRFVRNAEAATRARYGTGSLRRYAADLVVDREVRCEVAGLKALADQFVFRRAEASTAYGRQRGILQDLVAALVEGDGTGLDPAHAVPFREADSDAERLRVVVDQVAELTDSSALRWHARFARG